MSNIADHKANRQPGRIVMFRHKKDMRSGIFIILSILLFLIGCSYPIRYDGPYKGRVVDAETGAPIEGVVILGVWYKEIPTAAGAVGSYYDASETMTDKNGEFEIRGLGLKVFTNIAPMHVLIFKAGYKYIGPGMWESLSVDGGLLRSKVAWEGKRAIIPLRKLTIEERQKQGSPDFPSSAMGPKLQRMISEINRDRLERGLEPIGVVD